jgi:hypothetical protein
MEPLCQRLGVPCAFLRMIIMAVLTGGFAYYYGYNGWFSAGVGVASLVFMQVGYFVAVLYMVHEEKKRRK